MLGYSRTIYVEFTRSQNIESLLRCHLHAFDYFGGYPKELLYDHIKTVILTESTEGQGRRWNPKFLDFAGYYGIQPRLCRPYRARTKGKVERSIGYVKDNFFLGRSFTGLEELNHQARLWCDTKANTRVHATTKEVPFQRLKRENLLSHTQRPVYDTSEVVARKVTRDGASVLQGELLLRAVEVWRKSGYRTSHARRDLRDLGRRQPRRFPSSVHQDGTGHHRSGAS